MFKEKMWDLNKENMTLTKGNTYFAYNFQQNGVTYSS